MTAVEEVAVVGTVTATIDGTEVELTHSRVRNFFTQNRQDVFGPISCQKTREDPLFLVDDAH